MRHTLDFLRTLISRVLFYIRWESFKKSPLHFKYYGYKLNYEPGDSLVSRIASGYCYEPETIRCAIKGLPPDAVIFDIGANIGLITLAITRLAPYSLLHCFEPSPIPHSCLAYTITQNGLEKRITLNAVGLANHHGEVDFYIHAKKDASGDGLKDTERAGRTTVIRLPVITVDSYVRDKELKRLDLIKIDTEGAELLVLRGAENTIKLFAPKIIFEASPLNMKAYDMNCADVFHLLISWGYYVETVRGEAVNDQDTFLKAAAAGSDFVALHV